MKPNSPIIPKQPELKAAEDYYRLRREGIGFIERMGSRLWSDYNTHDPGITILETLCYALTDLGYRTGWDIKDILAPPKPAAEPGRPFPQQAFFTAGEILPVNPVTPDDFRRLLIDLDTVRNAWIFCKQCACDVHYYAYCEHESLTLSYQKPDAQLHPKKVAPQGLYEVLLELEADPLLGDLNDHKIGQAVADAKALLHSHRNLGEDYCRIAVIDVQDIAVCADVEVAADADIERVQAWMWFEIEQYCNPPVPFYTLQELLDAGVATEEIFNGPALSNGFIKAADLQAAELKTALRTSDIINRLMDIEGVISVNNLLLTAYDTTGSAVKGRADPDRESGVFDADKTSAAWLLIIGDRHRPRLNRNLSRFLFYKNGLPFMARMDEANDTLTQLRGEAERPKIKNAVKDLAIPAGIFRQPEDYFPLQYSFPSTYGIGQEGLPSPVSALRRAQARQLQAYLMVFEQLLGNALAQLAHTAELFSLDTDITQTYFVRELGKTLIQGYDELVKAELSQQDSAGTTALQKMLETPAEFQQRRNRFLDHLLARFGEQFSEYALLLSNYQGRRRALERLVGDKIAFLKAYPPISRNRAQAFDYTRPPDPQDNSAGINKRIGLLLGHPNLQCVWSATDLGVDKFRLKFRLFDNGKNIWLGYITLAAKNKAEAELFGYRALMERMSSVANYKIVKKAGKYVLKLTGSAAEAHGRHLDAFAAKDETEAARDELLAWSANERVIVVEHLLLRPKFPGDALYPACSEGGCRTCGDEDPYSFRLSFIMPGWTAPYNVNMEMRRFADRTIRQETPAHLLAKLCWVDNSGFEPNPCGEPVLAKLADWLEADANTAYTREQACACARELFDQYGALFKPWFDARKTQILLKSAWQTQISALFAAVSHSDLSCSAPLSADTWTRLQETLLAYFTDIALYGWQFERFEEAWRQWLEANAAIDWTEERLPERVEAILKSNLLAGDEKELCRCASNILTHYGMDFFQWMDSNFNAGKAWADFSTFMPGAVTLCGGFSFKAGTAAAIETLLQDRYDAYKKVSYRLWLVVNLLSKLRNTYPGATLHDCDDGSDLNPVLLGNTALGNYPLRASAS